MEYQIVVKIAPTGEISSSFFSNCKEDTKEALVNTTVRIVQFPDIIWAEYKINDTEVNYQTFLAALVS